MRALITRPRDPTDNAVPSGTSMAVELQLLLAELDGDEGARTRAALRFCTRVAQTTFRPVSRRYTTTMSAMTSRT